MKRFLIITLPMTSASLLARGQTPDNKIEDLVELLFSTMSCFNRYLPELSSGRRQHNRRPGSCEIK
jgi:hypothetical protein